MKRRKVRWISKQKKSDKDSKIEEAKLEEKEE